MHAFTASKTTVRGEELWVVNIAGADGETYAAWAYSLARCDKHLAALPPRKAYGEGEERRNGVLHRGHNAEAQAPVQKIVGGSDSI